MATDSVGPNQQQRLQDQHASTLEHLERLLADVSVRDLVPTLVARGVLFSHEMGNIYSQASQEQRIGKLVSILKTKKHCMGPLIDTLIRNGLTSIAESVMQLQPKLPPAAAAATTTLVDCGHKKTNGNGDLSTTMKNGNCNGATANACDDSGGKGGERAKETKDK